MSFGGKEDGERKKKMTEQLALADHPRLYRMRERSLSRRKKKKCSTFQAKPRKEKTTVTIYIRKKKKEYSKTELKTSWYARGNVTDSGAE